LGAAYVSGGSDGMMRQIFSSDTLAALAAWDLPVLLGRMPVELGVFVLMNIPENPAGLAKIPAAFAGITRLSRYGKMADMLGDLRTTVNVLKSVGKLTTSGARFLLLAGRDLARAGVNAADTAMVSSPDVQVLAGMMRTLLHGDPYTSGNALAFVNRSGDMLAETGRIFGEETVALGGKLKAEVMG
ncbi:MAG: hypothetical protein N2691_00005, partial [Patescibacteria group bacterium]|nr:hypothetical protein [Patescibacteria group bacterium]